MKKLKVYLRRLVFDPKRQIPNLLVFMSMYYDFMNSFNAGVGNRSVSKSLVNCELG